MVYAPIISPLLDIVFTIFPYINDLSNLFRHGKHLKIWLELRSYLSKQDTEVASTEFNLTPCNTFQPIVRQIVQNIAPIENTLFLILCYSRFICDFMGKLAVFLGDGRGHGHAPVQNLLS